MAIIRATAILNKVSGVPADASRNVWHFSADDTTTATLNGIAGGLAQFYSLIAAYLAPSVSPVAGAHKVDMAEVGFGTTPSGAPQVSPIIGSSTFGTPGTGGTSGSLPNEVAIALSFRAAIAGIAEEAGAQRPRSRRRGRIYVGPVTYSTVGNDATSKEPHVLVAVREAMLDAYDSAHGIWDGPASNIRHGIFSRVDGVLRIVEQVSVDNEFDTIRTRGRRASLRMTRAVGETAAGARSGVDAALAV